MGIYPTRLIAWILFYCFSKCSVAGLGDFFLGGGLCFYFVCLFFTETGFNSFTSYEIQTSDKQVKVLLICVWDLNMLSDIRTGGQPVLFPNLNLCYSYVPEISIFIYRHNPGLSCT